MLQLIKLYVRNNVRCQSGNTIVILGSVRVRKCNITIRGVGNKLVLHPGVNLKNCQVEIDGNGCELSIGRDCVIGEGCYLSCRESNTKLTIGDGCMFSRNAKVMTSDGHDILQSNSRINSAKSIRIGNHVWLADDVVVLKGVNIGDNCVVGMRSLLTSSIPNNAMAVGVPAKIIRTDITWRETLTF